MKALLLLRERFAVSDSAFVEIAIWRVPNPVRGSLHGFKYRLALVANEQCLLRYDNEAGKGDHKHIGELEVGYAFAGIEKLQTDFFEDVRQWLKTGHMT
jgi:Family of unknown function (DUF6516)